MSSLGEPSGRASGNGLLRGPDMTDSGIPESDLIPLAMRDPEALVKPGTAADTEDSTAQPSIPT